MDFTIRILAKTLSEAVAGLTATMTDIKEPEPSQEPEPSAPSTSSEPVPSTSNEPAPSAPSTSSEPAPPASTSGEPAKPTESPPQIDTSQFELGGKVAVVTGANRGIGLAIVKGLCQKLKGTVYLTARNPDKGKKAVKALEKEKLSPKFHQLDITDMKSITTFKEFLKAHHKGLDVLVNNAAITYKVTDPTPIGIKAERVIKTNYYGLLNVCKELFPLLRPHARVVNISSSAGMLDYIPCSNLRNRFASPTLTEEELTALMEEFVDCCKKGVQKKEGWSNWPYSVSKVGVTALTFIQQKGFNKDSRRDIIVNAVHPGHVDTDMSNHKGTLTPELGAETPIYLALLPPYTTSPKGEFVWCDKSVIHWDLRRMANTMEYIC